MKRPEPSHRERVCPHSWAWVVSILVGLHLLAVVAEPLRFFSQSDFQAGPEFVALRRWLAPYVDWMSLDHGYFFFAPNPGPSHLVAVDTGSLPSLDRSPPSALRPSALSPSALSPSALREGSPAGVDLDRFSYVFPDRKRQWPRLLYHRYFMLSEFYNNSFAPDRLLPEDMVDGEFVDRWKRDRGRYERLGASMGRSLAKELGANGVVLHRLERILPSPNQVMKEGWRLDDPRGLIQLDEGPVPVAPSQPSLPSTIAAPPPREAPP